MATCCYLELDLPNRTATAVLAGHPPPILRSNDQTRPLHLKPGPPLGTRHATYHEQTMPLPIGSSIVLYTDGLIEDRRNTVDRGLTQLCEAIQSAPTDDPADLVEHILNANVGPSPRSDDVAILALTLLPQPPT